MKFFQEHIEQSLDEIPNYKKKTFLLAVSGGVDSMVLMHIFNSLGLLFEVAHCNFNLRGSDSDEDEKLVRLESKNIDVEFNSKSFDVQNRKKEDGSSTQMAARDLRYEWFHELLLSKEMDYLVTAHHHNDNIETVLLNLTRGTGIKGLTGMEVLSNRIFRPMLSTSKKEIFAYAELNKVNFRKDKSNDSNDYSRNKIRNKVVPLLEELNPSFVETMKQNISNFNSVNELYQFSIDKQLSQGLIQTKEDLFIIDIPKLMGLKNYKNILYEYLSRFGFNMDVVSQLCQGILSENTTGKQFLSDSYKALLNRDTIVLSPLHFKEVKAVFIDKIDKNVTYPIPLALNTISKESVEIDKDSCYAFLDMEKLVFPLELRKWKQGDVFQPFGMVGKKKVSDYLIDNKVSLIEKERVFVLLSNNEIVWLIGYRTSDKFKITSATNTVLKIKLNNGNAKFSNKEN